MSISRRIFLSELTPIEVAIRDAILEVEAMEADVRLTDAVVLLQAAKDSIGDYIDRREGIRRRVITNFRGDCYISK